LSLAGARYATAVASFEPPTRLSKASPHFHCTQQKVSTVMR
jgi:hypothetical protein